MRHKRRHPVIQRAPWALLTIMLTVVGIHGAIGAWGQSPAWAIAAALGAAYFLVGTVIIITGRSWWERHSKR